MIKKFLNNNSKIQIYFIFLILVAVTLLLRLPGYNSTQFWIDELWRINLFLDPHILDRYLYLSDPQTSITSPIYILINKLISFINISPFAFRLSSLIPSIGVVILSFLLIRNIGGNLALCILIALFFSTNHQFIRYSNELKPYMLEVLVHCACMYLWVRSFIFHSTNKFEYRSLFTALVVSILTTANIIFILPSVFITLLFQNKNNRAAVLYILKFGLLPSFITTLFCYLFIWSSGADEGMISFWSEGFSNIDDNYLFWIARKFFEVTQGAFLFSTGVVPNRKYWFCVFLVIVYFFIFKRNLIKLDFLKFAFSFYFIFVFFLVAFNLLKLWPLGNFRPNLFIYCHIFICFGFLFVALKDIKLISWLLCVGLIIFIIQLTQTNFTVLNQYSPPQEEHDKVWQSFDNSSPLITTINDECNLNNESIFFMTPAMRYAFVYHRNQDQNNNLPQSLLLTDCVKIIPLSDEVLYDNNNLVEFIKKNTMGNQPFWFLYSFVLEDNVKKIRNLLDQIGHVNYESNFVNAGFFHITR